MSQMICDSKTESRGLLELSRDGNILGETTNALGFRVPEQERSRKSATAVRCRKTFGYRILF
jgi:hypothetical protein